MPDPLAHHPSMLIVKPDSLPRLWWLFPWSVCRQLHRNCNALRALADKLDAEATALRSSREHWIAKHDRAYAVAMHNERVIADMENKQHAVMQTLREDYTARQRWQIEENESENGVRYYFYDTHPHNYASGVNYTHFNGKAYLYDGPSKCFAYETDLAKAIARVNELNTR